MVREAMTTQLEFPQSFLPWMAIGPEWGMYMRGALVANTMCMPVAMFVLSFLIGKAKKRNKKDATFLEVISAGRIVTFLFLPLVLGLDGTVSSAVSLALNDEPSPDFVLDAALMVASFAVIIGIVFFGLHSVHAHIPLRFFVVQGYVRQKPNVTTLCKPNATVLRVLQGPFGKWVVFGEHAWRPSNPTLQTWFRFYAPLFVRFHGPLLEDRQRVVDAASSRGCDLQSLRRRALASFFACDFCLTAVISTLKGMARVQTDAVRCGRLAWIAVGVNVFVAVLFVLARPYSIPLKNFTGIVASFVTGAASVLAAMELAPQAGQLSLAAGVIPLLAMFITVTRLTARWFFGIHISPFLPPPPDAVAKKPPVKYENDLVAEPTKGDAINAATALPAASASSGAMVVDVVMDERKFTEMDDADDAHADFLGPIPALFNFGSSKRGRAEEPRDSRADQGVLTVPMLSIDEARFLDTVPSPRPTQRTSLIITRAEAEAIEAERLRDLESARMKRVRGQGSAGQCDFRPIITEAEAMALVS